MKRHPVLFCLTLIVLLATNAWAECPAGTICLADERFEVRVEVPSADGGSAAALPLFAHGDVAWFSAISWTGDPFNPDIAVKVVDFRSLNDSFLVFHAPLTNLAYTVTVRDRATGTVKSFIKEIDSFCGAVEMLPAPGASARSDSRVTNHGPTCGSDPNELCLFNDRFRIRLTARIDDSTTIAGHPLPHHESFGSFSLPTLTHDPERAEVAVKLIDGYDLDRSVWVFHAALTHVPYTLEIVDTISGQKHTYDGSRHCGGSALGGLPSEPCRSASILSITGNDPVAAGSSATLQVNAVGTPPLRYQWRRRTPEGTFVDILGAIASRLETGPLNGPTTFDVRVENGCGTSQVLAATVPAKPLLATLTVRKRGSGTGSVNTSPGGLRCNESASTCQATFPVGSNIRLTALAAVDSSFSGWAGACGGTGNCTLSLDGDEVVNVRFEPASASILMPGTGGKADLEGIGEIHFPGGSLPQGTPVTVTSTRSPETRNDFDTTAVLFSPTARSVYEVRINTGLSAPSGDVIASLRIPPVLLTASANGEIQVLAQILEDGGDEVLDSFELLESNVSGTTVETTVPPEAFTDLRTANGYEAILIIAVTPTKPSTAKSVAPTAVPARGQHERPLPPPFDAISESFKHPFVLHATDCNGASLGEPIAGGAPISQSFNPKTPHYGTDFRVPNGTPVQSMADGTVEVVDFQVKPLAKPHPKTRKLVSGWGHYVVVRHTDGSASLYAHLEMNGVIVQKNQKVSRGDVLAESDNSGGSSGPHLHVEYAPNGAIFVRASKVDPAPCIGSNVNGSISVRDNGTLADDSFTVFLNGAAICTTAIGASNTCAASNLRPGTITLTLKCNIAPDNVGTYEISLANGLTFQGGGTTRSGTLAEGASHSFSVTVPSSP